MFGRCGQDRGREDKCFFFRPVSLSVSLSAVLRCALAPLREIGRWFFLP
jgi:hypothetical protein